MIFGSISYINLLPFQVFLKKYLKNSQIKQILNYKKSFPSEINKNFKKRKVDAAFISSIKSKNCKCTNLGIVANGRVYSVLLLPKTSKDDIESDTSNMLSKVLGLNGEVIIGDKALKLYLQNKNLDYIDLSEAWMNRYNLPFVFARLCYNKHGEKIKKIEKAFKKSKAKIPQYYLKKSAKEHNLTSKQISWYLKHISYELKYHEKMALKKFIRLSDRVG